jgi:hypothetical protein
MPECQIGAVRCRGYLGVVVPFSMIALWDEGAAEEELDGPCPKIFASSVARALAIYIKLTSFLSHRFWKNILFEGREGEKS